MYVDTYTYVYIHMYVCVCVCVCVYSSQTHGNKKQNVSCQSLQEEKMKMTPVGL